MEIKMEFKEENLNNNSPVILAACACLEAYKKIYWFHSTEMKMMQAIFLDWADKGLGPKSFEYLILNALVNGTNEDKQLTRMLSNQKGKKNLLRAHRRIRKEFLIKYELCN